MWGFCLAGCRNHFRDFSFYVLAHSKSRERFFVRMLVINRGYSGAAKIRISRRADRHYRAGGVHRRVCGSQIHTPLYQRGLTVDFSSILFVSIVVGRVSWCSWPPEDLQGIAVLVGFLIFTGAWYMIVRFDPSLK
jgi:hypothetical protein